MGNRFSLRRLTIFPVILCIMWVIPGFAADPEQPFMEILGPTTLTLPPGTTSEAQVNLEVPVRLLKPGPEITLQTVSATLGAGSLLNPSVFSFVFEPQGDQGLGTIKVTINRQQTERTGEYTVTVLAWRPDQAPPGQTGTLPPPEAPPKLESQKLIFKFTKPSAKLQLATKKIERVIFLPGKRGCLYPDTLLLSETSGDSAVIPFNQEWRTDLSLADGQTLPGRLLVSGIKAMDPWKQEEVKVALEGAPPLGTARGTITIRAPELAANQTDFPIDLISRISRIWLLIFIGCSILVGWLFREYLEKRQARDKALMAAEEQRGLLLGLLDKTVDEELKRQLQEELDKLVTAIGQKVGQPEDLTKAAEETRQKTDAILKKAADQRSDQETDVKKIMASLNTPEQAAAVTLEIKQAKDWLEAQQSDLSAGYIKRVEDALAKDKPNWLKKIRQSLQLWLSEVDTALGKVRPWPENELDQKLATLTASVRDTEKTTNAINDFDKLGTLLQTTNDIWWQLKSDLFKRRNEVIGRQAAEILQRLRKLFPDPQVFPLDDLQDAIRQYDELRKDDRAADNLAGLVEAEGNLWNSLQEALGKGYKLDNIQKFSGLDQGKFFEALKNLQEKRQMGLESATEAAAEWRPISLELPSELAQGVTQTKEPVWLVSIKPPLEAVAGEPLTLELLVVTPPGQPTPNIVVQWSVVGEPLLGMPGVPGNLTWKFTPPTTGTLVVQAEATDSKTGQKQNVQVSLEVLPPRGFPAVLELKRQLRRTERLQTLISGLIITAIGYAIFRVSFVGTIDDFLAAGLWGFTMDIGVAKVREYAAPVLPLKPKLPTGT